jgi:hypothetical protein
MYLYYETQTLFELDMFQYRTCVCVGLRHDTDTYNYIELYHFSNYYRCQRVRDSVRVMFGVCA